MPCGRRRSGPDDRCFCGAGRNRPDLLRWADVLSCARRPVAEEPYAVVTEAIDREGR